MKVRLSRNRNNTLYFSPPKQNIFNHSSLRCIFCICFDKDGATILLAESRSGVLEDDPHTFLSVINKSNRAPM